MSYDRKADVIYISFGKPRKAVSEEIDPYVLVRRDPKTKEILGITITNFQILRNKKATKHKNPRIMSHKPVSLTP